MTGATEISVIVATHNRATVLPRAVASVLDQGDVDLDLVVVDDGSEDDTCAVVKAIADARVRYVRQANQGQACARNKGAAIARGRSLVFLDDDDIALPDSLRRLADAVTGPCAVASGSVLLDYQDHTLQVEPKPMGPVFEDFTFRLLAGGYAIRQDAFTAVGGFTPGLRTALQTELALRLMPLCRTRGWEVRTVDGPLVRITSRPAPERDAPEVILEGTQLVLEEHADRLARSPWLLANFFATAGVAAARSGRTAEARSLLFAACRHNPWHWRHYARLALAAIPPAGHVVWNSAAFRRTTDEETV